MRRMKALAKNDDERYGSARRFSEDLSDFVAKSGALAARGDVA
jgi:hypothetical protein